MAIKSTEAAAPASPFGPPRGPLPYDGFSQQRNILGELGEDQSAEDRRGSGHPRRTEFLGEDDVGEHRRDDRFEREDQRRPGGGGVSLGAVLHTEGDDRREHGQV